ncbi:MAG: LuxR C-terminal-related transcriptional regulator [Clostridiaceae bacterium]|nr:LuxR C-terminal-related transcriptional regulator [Clostridiaceae bacterium]
MPRPRVTEKIGDCVHRKLTLVLAPSGYGKSTAVQAWAENAGLPCAWFTADPGDNTPGVFWRYVCAALDGILPGISMNTDYVFSSPELLEANTQINIIIDSFSEYRNDCVLIIDDMQCIVKTEIYKAILYLINYLPPCLHLIFIGRSESWHGLASQELKSQVLRVGMRDLCFKGEEIAEFYAKRNIKVENHEVQKLEAYTEGWAAALVAVAMALEKAPDKYDEAAVKEDCGKNIEQFLMEEVLSSWPEEKKRFVFETSVLDTLSEELCDCITGGDNGGQLLREMSERNEFMVSLDGRHYRYHYIFKAFLYRHISMTQPDLVEALHVRAAVWYAKQEMYPEAILHYLDGCRFAEACLLIEQQLGELVMGNSYETGLSWLGRLPKSYLDRSPKIAAFYSAYHTENGQFDLSEKWLCKADVLLDAMEESLPKKEIKNIVCLLWSYLFLKQGKTDALFAVAGKIDSKMTSPRRMARYLNFNGSDIYFYRCPISSMVKLIVEDIEDYAVLKSSYGRIIARDPGYESLAVGEYNYETNRLDEALPYLIKALEAAWSAECTGVLVPAMVNIARIKKAYGDMQGALETLSECESSLKKLNQIHWTYLIQAFSARFYLESGNIEAVNRWADARRLGIYSHINKINEFELIVYARMLMKRNQPDDARLLLLRLLSFADTEGRQHSKTEILNLLAILACQKGDAALSEEYLSQTLAIGLREGYYRSFLDEGWALLRPLKRFADRRQGDVAGENLALFSLSLIDKIKAEARTVKTGGREEADRIKEKLTAKELEVLELLYAANTNEDICVKLNISLRTVKTHTGSIYSKLGVSNRVQCNKLVRESRLFDFS